MATTETYQLFYLTSDIDEFVQICINNMDGDIDYTKIGLPEFPKTKPNQVYIGATLITNSVPVCEYEERTPTRDYISKAEWNDRIVFPVYYKELDKDAIIVLRVYCYHPTKGYVTVGEAALPLFNEEKGFTLRKGSKRVKVHTCTSVGTSSQISSEPYRRTRLLHALHGTTPPRPSSKKNALERAEKYQTEMVTGSCAMNFLDQFTASIVPAFRQDEEKRAGSLMYITLNLPEFEQTVRAHHSSPNVVNSPVTLPRIQAASCGPIVELASVGNGAGAVAGEKMYMKLSAALDAKAMADAKPATVAEYKRLEAISRMPASVTTLSSEQKALLRKYGKYLANTSPKSLNIFLTQAIDWDDPHEATEAFEFVKIWQKVDVEDALGLLALPDARIREYAVDALRRLKDDELESYMFSLVQALSIERSEGPGRRHLADFLIERCVDDFVLGNWLFWYLTVESESALSTANDGSFYKWVKDTFVCKRNPSHHALTERQVELVTEITKLQMFFISDSASRPEKLTKLKEWTTSLSLKNIFAKGPIPLPLNPSIYVTSINSEGAHIFKSNKAPLKLPFVVDVKTTKEKGGVENPPDVFQVIVKHGDDLRQDQLILQMEALMDSLLKKDLMDLKLTPYKVLATSPIDGMVEFVPSAGIGDIINNGTLRDYLTRMNGGSIPSSVMTNFVRSVAGNSVITYLLGVGDRHLDNLLMTADGKMFHIDFGYILGKECKPFPPPMKLCKEIVECMGGKGSQNYQDLSKLCCECYNALRKSSKLIMNLFQLMTNSNIQVFLEMGSKVIIKLKEKLRMELTDERASKIMVGLIETSVDALFPVFVDSFHDFVQYWVCYHVIVFMKF
ncbi:phosphatidylinositol 3-kinase [Entamoeba marina]